MKVAKIKFYFSILIWRDSPFSRATIKCDFTVLIDLQYKKLVLISFLGMCLIELSFRLHPKGGGGLCLIQLSIHLSLAWVYFGGQLAPNP